MEEFTFSGEWMKDDILYLKGITPEIITEMRSFEMTKRDVLIASYPKTGTTWTQELVWLLRNNGNLTQALSIPVYERVLYLEYKQEDSKSGLEQKQIEAGKVKIIVVIRNPKDTLVSLYHFYGNMHDSGVFEGTWDDFFELYKAKHVIYGDYFDWYSSWLPHIEKHNVMLVKYEDMQHKLPDVYNDVARFLDDPLSYPNKADIIEHLTFDRMRRNDMVNYKNISGLDLKSSPFMRKGIIGDWKNTFSDEQSRLVDKRYHEVIEAFGISLEFE
ncbi:hypothetical protein LSH36_12g36069 [Paralvinella palmiformis]|uniref:Sulfotransferase domain-containing protein n=1 Tax=Paralvinella palmiformis TaxID=53620 RepID=A0AAD9KCJ9_9ANNE|nr:hypothetical protein LSH36_12g36069 [Paralvinella palmiformis]